MEPMLFIALLKDFVGIALLPLSYFSWRILQEFKDGKDERNSLKSAIKALGEQQTKHFEQKMQAIEKVGELVRTSEKDNRTEHKELGQKIHELETTNKVEHAILSNGGKL